MSALRLRSLVLAALTALGGLLAAMAYSESTVTLPAMGAVVRSDSALLAVGCNENFEEYDGICTVGTDGNLRLDFAASLWTGSGYVQADFSDPGPGFQPGSEYEFNDIIVVKNNGTRSVRVGVSLTGDLAAPVPDVGIEVVAAAGTRDQTNVLADSYLLGAGDYVPLSFKFTVPNDRSAGEGAGHSHGHQLAGQVIIRAE